MSWTLPELGTCALSNFFGVQIGALYSDFGCTSGQKWALAVMGVVFRYYRKWFFYKIPQVWKFYQNTKYRKVPHKFLGPCPPLQVGVEMGTEVVFFGCAPSSELHFLVGHQKCLVYYNRFMMMQSIREIRPTVCIRSPFLRRFRSDLTGSLLG